MAALLFLKEILVVGLNEGLEVTLRENSNEYYSNINRSELVQIAQK